MIISKKSSMFLISIILSLFVHTGAYADILYSAASNGYNNDRIGLIEGFKAPAKDLVTNLGGTMGSNVFSYKTAGGASRVAVSQYTGGEDVIWIYNPYDTSWKAPMAELGSKENPIYNIRSMAASGNYLYGIGYDKSQVARFDMKDNKYVRDKYFAGLGNYWHGEGLVTYKDHVYGVFTYSTNPWNPSAGYGPNRLIKFDKDLNIVTSMDLNSRNVDGGSVKGACTLYGDTLYIAAIGGFQHYDGTPNDESMVEAVNLDTMTAKVLVKNTDLYNSFPEIKKWIYDFRSICITPNKDVYIQTGGWNYGGGGNGCLIFKTTLDKLKAGNVGTIVKNFSWTSAFIVFGMAYDKETGCLYTTGAEGSSQYNGSVYRYDGNKWLPPYDSNALGGNICAFDVLKKPSFTFSSDDVSVKSDAGAVSAVNIKLNDEVSDLSGISDYSTVINGIDSNSVVRSCTAITVSLDHSLISDMAPVTFTIENFTAELSSNGRLMAFIKKHGSAKYDMFDATYNADTKKLTFTIEPVGDYFTEGTVVIGEAAGRIAPEHSSSGSSGCNAGFGWILLFAALPVAVRKVIYFNRKR